MPNRLQYEKSPYLLQHKNNPVDWYPWGKDALEKAKSEDKPIFLSIGYSTCHWCHVMEQESFEDEEVAEHLKPFVCIKVDREERPDLDTVYMNVCQALTGSGGWPLTILMTPEQKPFFAGTYFPKNDRYGQYGLIHLIDQTKYLWDNKREQLTNAGEQITLLFSKNEKLDFKEPDPSILREAFHLLQKRFDPVWGGFGKAPKFPTPHNMMFLLRFYQYEKEPKALEMVEKTLQSMAKGGIFDQIGGGFSRYSTDHQWLVPHFEKMLYDNALLILLYLEAYQLTKNDFYATIAEQTADYILRELTDPDGGFYCGQDADSDGVEGKYYVFTPEEIIDVLGEEKGKEFCRLYNITDNGNFEGQNIPNLIGQESKGWQGDDPHFMELYEYRKKRTKLHCDDKILLSWNAWTIMALTRAALILKNDRYLSAALETQRFIEHKMTDKQNHLFHRFCKGEAAYAGQLDDYAVYALALLELYAVTFDVKYLQMALLRTNQIIDLFRDQENGGFYMNANDAEQLIMRPKELYDGALPSGNSVAAVVLERLASLTGQIKWRQHADLQQKFITGQIRNMPIASCFSLLSMADSLYPHKELICTGNKIPKELIAYLRDHPATGLNIIFKSPENESLLSKTAPITKDYPIPKDGNFWYLCENGTCHTPVTDFEALEL